MNKLSLRDKKRLEEIAKALKQIKSDSIKDELVGASKWALVQQQPQQTA